MTRDASMLEPGALARAAQAPPPAAVVQARPLVIPSLDGLRAVSFLLVFLSHAGIAAIPGGFGVTVFFFLSGYLITTLMRRELEQTNTIQLSKFYQRRALRILPPFYLVLLAVTALTFSGLLYGYILPAAFASQLLHYCNYWFAFRSWDGIGTGTGVYWSLAIEEHFYLVFPALYLLLHRRGMRGREQAMLLWSLCLLVLAWRCVLVFGFAAASHRVAVASDTRADSMLLGCALAVWHNPALDDLDRPLSTWWLRVWLPLSLGLIAFTLVYRSDSFRDTFRYSAQGLALYPLFVTVIRRPDWGPYRALNTPLLRRVGAQSYSLYLVHHTVIDAVRQYLTDNVLICTAVGLAGSLGLAQAIFVVVEEPCARFRRRLH